MEIMNVLNIHHWNPDVFKLCLSIVLGTAIGMEREVSNKVAGLRTNVLICLGAALFTMLSNYSWISPGAHDFHIAAQIVTGIGFLGAGTIMREGERVTGLTTAATVWTVAAVGMAVGYGHYTLASLVTVAVLLVQLAFTKLDILIDDWRMRHNFRVLSRIDDKSIDEIGAIFRDCRVRIIHRKLMKKNNLYYSEWYTTGGRAGQEKAMKRLVDSKEVIEVVY
jgi:putative Mg2+ transporter-C (MgtC) family protein